MQRRHAACRTARRCHRPPRPGPPGPHFTSILQVTESGSIRGCGRPPLVGASLRSREVLGNGSSKACLRFVPDRTDARVDGEQQPQPHPREPPDRNGRPHPRQPARGRSPHVVSTIWPASGRASARNLAEIPSPREARRSKSRTPRPPACDLLLQRGFECGSKSRGRRGTGVSLRDPLFPGRATRGPKALGRAPRLSAGNHQTSMDADGAAPFEVTFFEGAAMKSRRSEQDL